MKGIPYILLMLIILLIPSCESGEGVCTTDIISRVNAGFYVRDSMGERDTLLNNFTFSGALRPDSLIYDSAAGVQKIVFPLPHSTEAYTSFLFSADALTGTINIYHTPSLVLVSYACGFTTNHNIYRVLHDSILIDTVSIVNPLVNLSDEENLKIYIKPAVADTVV